ncbi:erythromycin esterase family protein [Phytomonospora endophytica]|uniref:Erythromycin esterase n=1 Tax=Phytomonospora endophytica TaxID=714109 RepID=A0A841FQC9_9ACTN|nr:erythromycin esterase family protein [Phytomonospora endophytica]MBB6035762.1 erythromycin esterase [Phytomonospora endophytica]GIG69559.1 succinoglycan biosynthesis [Phytomonospora endophytica]
MPTTSPSTEVTGWLSRNAVRLTGLEPGTDLTDLKGLTDVLGGARIVGLGESTHGTAEFFRLKHRLVEYLVTEHGCTVFAMEASASAAADVDAYIRYGTGDAAEVLAGLGFWTWRTAEVLALFEWLRAHNRDLPEHRRVRFAGIDPQRCDRSIAALEGFLSGPGDPLRVLGTADPGSRPDPERRLFHQAGELLDRVTRADGGPEALRHARILVRAADLVTRPRVAPDPADTVFAARDRYMADAVAEILDADPAATIALWAHNGHLARTRYGGGIAALGSHLAERHGDDYYALGLLFGSGRFRARRMWPWPSWPGAVATNGLGPAPGGTVEATLGKAVPGPHLVDLRAAAAVPAVRDWLAAPHMTRTHGAVVRRRLYRLSMAPVKPAEEFDGLAYVPVSTPSVPLPARE